MIFEKLAALLAEQFSVVADSITMDTTFEDLGADSLDIVEMTMAVEEEFGLEDMEDEDLSGIATGASWLCYYRALQDGLASIVVPIDKLSILVTVAFSYFVFHERLSKKSAIGLVLIVAGTLAMLI